jgi:hypothetical protein
MAAIAGLIDEKTTFTIQELFVSLTRVGSHRFQYRHSAFGHQVANAKVCPTVSIERLFNNINAHGSQMKVVYRFRGLSQLAKLVHGA